MFCLGFCAVLNGRLYTSGRIIHLNELGQKHSLFVWLYVSTIKTGTGHIIRLDEYSSVVRLKRRTTEDSSSRRIMRLVPVFILKTYN